MPSILPRRASRSVFLPLAGILLSLFVSACGNNVKDKLSEGEFYMKQREFELAEQTFNEVIEKHPEIAEAYNNLGHCLLQLKRPDDAYKNFELARDRYTKDEDKSVAINNMGQAKFEMGDKEGSIKLYEEALGVYADNHLAYVNIAVAAYDTGDFNAATVNLLKADEKLPNNFTILTNLAETYFRRHQWEKAIETFMRVKEIEPNYASFCLHRVGYAYLEGGDLANAKKSYQQSLSLDPNNPFTLSGLALATAMDATEGDERFMKGMEMLAKAQSVMPHAVIIHRNRGMVYEMMGEPELALLAWKMVLNMDPKNDEIRGFIARLTEKTGLTLESVEGLDPSNFVPRGQRGEQGGEAGQPAPPAPAPESAPGE